MYIYIHIYIYHIYTHKYIYIYVCIYIYTHIYINRESQIERKRERERVNGIDKLQDFATWCLIWFDGLSDLRFYRERHTIWLPMIASNWGTAPTWEKICSTNLHLPGKSIRWVTNPKSSSVFSSPSSLLSQKFAWKVRELLSEIW